MIEVILFYHTLSGKTKKLQGGNSSKITNNYFMTFLKRKGVRLLEQIILYMSLAD